MEKQKECFKCHKLKYLTEFYKHPQMPDGTVNKCKQCNKTDNQTNWQLKRKEKIEYDKYRHRYSIQRIFNHRYSGIKTRCTIGGSHIYSVTGKKFLSKKDWNKWCYQDKNYAQFINIYSNWVQSEFKAKLSPSIDRINSKKGYVIGNLQWLTQSDNCKKYNK